ncbi:hypothetical protein [Herpetosiphon gulosus]|uniref:Uncharacterized protein n=1 Tax=Herpetosiphon gulosus TaxID=1973496 RepID=A0ABP9X3Y5_9CHLR
MEQEALVTRTYRAAIRSGDDYITIEETIALPPTADDAAISQAVETGWRIFRAQQAAVEAQISALRDAHPAMTTPRIADPDSPASDKQRSYLEYLINTLAINDGQMQTTLQEHNATYETLTKGQASEIIDGLKQQLDHKPATSQSSAAASASASSTSNMLDSTASEPPASTRQLAALQRVAGQQGVDLSAEIRQRFGAQQLDDLSVNEAGALLQELQQRSVRR